MSRNSFMELSYTVNTPSLLNLVLLLYCFMMYIMSLKGDCAMLNFCNGHGICNELTSSCDCFEGWGSASDVTFYRAPDCSARVCPSGKSWADVPISPTQAHQLQECSNRGSCDRLNGQCQCFQGFTGSACNRMECPNNCSGHGVCVSLKQMARMQNALPLAPNTFYEGDPDNTTWDEDMIYGCVCDSSWSVGLSKDQRQEPEWFGPDCSLRHCPSADNPRTPDVDETNCSGIQAKDSIYFGEPGNICQVDCANSGLCDYSSGKCSCFNGFYGLACSIIDTNVEYQSWKSNINSMNDDL